MKSHKIPVFLLLILSGCVDLDRHEHGFECTCSVLEAACSFQSDMRNVKPRAVP